MSGARWVVFCPNNDPSYNWKELTVIETGINAPWDSAGIKACKELNVTQLRIGWEDTWDFNQLRSIVLDIKNNGFNVVLAVTPASRKYGEQRFIDFSVKAAALLTPKDVLEVHNEGNHKPFALSPDAVACANQYVKIQDQVRKLQFPPKVIIGGLATESGQLDPRQFIPAMVRANPGVLNTDGMALHPYEFPWDPRSANSWNPVSYLDTSYTLPSKMPSLNSIWSFCGRPNMPFYLTEFGAPSGKTTLATGAADPNQPGSPYRFNEAFQSEWLTRYVEAFAASKANIVSAVWYTLDDGLPGAGADWDPFIGVRKKVAGTWKWKPVAQTFRTWGAATTRASRI